MVKLVIEDTARYQDKVTHLDGQNIQILKKQEITLKCGTNVGNHPENYNAYNTILDGIAAVAPAYSPNSDPANIRLGYTTDAYSKGMVEVLKTGGFNVKTTRQGDAPRMTPGGTAPASPSRGSYSSMTATKTKPKVTPLSRADRAKFFEAIKAVTGGGPTPSTPSPQISFLILLLV